MEKQLRDQLDRLEYKPSDSMWNRIENEMRGDFEHSLEQKLRRYDVAPDPALWEKIEAELPIERKKNHSGTIIIALLLLSLIGLSAFLLQQTIQLNPKAHLLTTNESSQPSSALQNVPNKVLPNVNNLELIANQKEQLNIKESNTSSNKNKLSLSEEIITPKVSYKIKGNKSFSLTSLPANTSKPFAPTKPESSSAVYNNEVVNINSVGLNSANPVSDLPVSSHSTTHENSLSDLPNHAAPKSSTLDIASINPKTDSNAAASPIASTIKPFQEPTTDATAKVPKVDEDAPTNFSISILTGANLCYNRLVAPSTGTLNFDKNISLRNQLENTAIDWSGLFLLDYHVTDRFLISSGMGILNFSQSFYYNTTTPMVVNPGVETRAVIINPNDSIINGNTLSTRIKYSWTEIPVYLSYQFTQNRRFNFELQGGFSFALLSTVDAGMVSYDNVGVLLIKDKAAFPTLRNSFFISLSPTITYNLNPTVKLGIMPSAKVSINSMIDNSNWVQQYPYFVGFSAMLRKRF